MPGTPFAPWRDPPARPGIEQMMVRHLQSSIAGYQGHPVPRRFVVQNEGARRLAVIQPGCGYNRDMPVRYFTAEQPVVNGADVLQVNCAYDANPDYAAADVATRETWVTAAVIAAYNAAAGQRPYKWITVVAKSLGTRALARLPASCPSPRPWTGTYTSIFSDPNVARELRGARITVIGSGGHGRPLPRRRGARRGKLVAGHDYAGNRSRRPCPGAPWRHREVGARAGRRAGKSPAFLPI